MTTTKASSIDPKYVAHHKRAIAAYETGDLKKALRIAVRLLNDTDVPQMVRVNVTALVIDCSSVATNVEPIEQAIAVLAEHLSQAGDKRDVVAYNLANGHIAAFQVENRLAGRRGYVFSSAHLDESKDLLRSVIDSADADRELKSTAYVNYASTFSKVGRWLEVLAIDKDALASNPHNAVAEGGIGSAMAALAATVGEHRRRLLEEAKHHLTRALRDEAHLVQYGTASSPVLFRKRLSTIERQLAKKEGTYNAPKLDNAQGDLEIAYSQFCLRHDLMLNYCSICTQCPGEMRDTIFFRSVRTDIDDDSKFRRLATFFNQIKEDYATARYLAFLAERQSSDVDSISVMTRYANTLDYPAFDLYGGVLKASFRTAADALDKVAGLIAVYLDITDPPPDRLSFGNLWWDRTYQLREPFDTLLPKNAGIAALADLARDWRKPGRPERRLYDLRNSLVHRFVALHSEFCTDTESDQGQHLGQRTFNEQSIEMLRLVRAAIVYMTMAIVSGEQEKRAASEGLVLPMYFNFSQEPDYRVNRQAEEG